MCTKHTTPSTQDMEDKKHDDVISGRTNKYDGRVHSLIAFLVIQVKCKSSGHQNKFHLSTLSILLLRRLLPIALKRKKLQSIREILLQQIQKMHLW